MIKMTKNKPNNGRHVLKKETQTSLQVGFKLNCLEVNDVGVGSSKNTLHYYLPCSNTMKTILHS